MTFFVFCVTRGLIRLHNMEHEVCRQLRVHHVQKPSDSLLSCIPWQQDQLFQLCSGDASSAPLLESWVFLYTVKVGIKSADWMGRGHRLFLNQN